MHGDETPDAYLNRAQEYADALLSDHDYMLVVSGLREEYNGLKTTITVRQSPTAFSELHALLSDHDYMLGKTRAPTPSITSYFAANYAVGSPSMPKAHQAQLSKLTAQLSALGFQGSPIASSDPQAFYGARPSNNNRNNNNNNRGNRNNSCGNNSNRGWGNGHQFDWASTQYTVYGTYNRCDIRANSHVTPDLEAMDNSEAYYGDDALHVGDDESTHTTLLTGPSKHGLYTIVLPQLKCLCFPHLRLYNSDKMDFYSTPCVFLGYSPSHHGYRCLDISTEHLYIARHVRFNEAQFPFDIPKTTSPPPSKTSPYYSSKSPYVIPTTDHPSPSSPCSPISSPSSVLHLSPTSQTSPESSNGQPSPVSTTSIPTPPPPTPPPPPITHPVVKSTTIRVVLSLAFTNNWPLRKLDVHNAFLHRNHKEQAMRAWFERLSKSLFDLSFKGSKTDPSLFSYSRGHTLLYILVYVDDIIVTRNNKGTIDNIVSQLGSAFALKYRRPINYFLGIEIVPHVFGIILSQKKYILELLQSAGLSNYNPVSSPMVTLGSLSLDDNTAFSNLVKYRQVVGSLQYVTLSRPDIFFAVNKVCQYMHDPTKNHWSAVKRILRYLHGTVKHGMLKRRSSGSTLQAFTNVLWKGNPDTSLEAFSDADWARDSDDR
ncbi:retrovirus-related pol polyprotein from transposon TNT 1-94 [Tanacetum coccineum]|uniref:Retrovirus-related pol polyprotein from transposon TNT 1-94 n=1 Tax=Tanacetum coccineum TaxID=301880 RepID=A0ABQ5GA15_9ASTR